jgi:hypothetical protein
MRQKKKPAERIVLFPLSFDFRKVWLTKNHDLILDQICSIVFHSLRDSDIFTNNKSSNYLEFVD